MMSNSDLTTFKPFDHHKRYTTMLDILWCAICSAHSNSNSDQLVRTCEHLHVASAVVSKDDETTGTNDIGAKVGKGRSLDLGPKP